MAQDDGSPVRGSDAPLEERVDTVSVLYILGGIPAIVGFLVVLFAIGVRYCHLPA